MSGRSHTQFPPWGSVFAEPAITLAAMDRLVHHSTILPMNALCRPSSSSRPALLGYAEATLPSLSGAFHPSDTANQIFVGP
jgi:hypothetical protein